jgi:hypothetical protein
MPDPWMPGATRLDIGDHQPTDGGPAKAVPHITWDENATAARPVALVPYERLVDYFGRNPDGKAVAPHILWDPFTGRITQFVPANCRSKSLADSAGGTRTNRAGYVVIQVEALFFPYCKVDGKVYPRLVDTPCKGWAELHAWIRSWGVPDAWPNGRPEKCTRNEKTWETKGGWYPHAAVPENDHGDPLTWPDFPAPVPQQPAQSEEDDMPTMITEVEDGGPDLEAGEWTLLKMAADSAIAQGPCRYTVACYVVVSGAPGTRVTGRFHDLLLKTGRPSADLPQDAGVIGKDGTLNAVFTRPGDLVADEQLKLEVMTDAPAKVTYRLLRGLRWAV